MSDYQLYFFVIYLAIQVLLPLRRFIKVFIIQKGKGDLMSDSHFFFSWTMMLRTSTGYVDFTVFDRNTGEVILRFVPDEVLHYRQHLFLSKYPSCVIMYAKYLQKLHRLDEKNYGIHVYFELNVNERGFKKVVDERTDFCQEKVKVVGLYDWMTYP
ncbi:MAG: HTTM domain-containing protein [Chlamydiales bacterium]|nr:HTTM domain-containing protein [Chlamydiia bacterium]MCP5508261.1 HTTM domain-containing protein [Chlamydiales bacterium]